MFFPTTKIKIERYTKTGESATGEDILSWTEIYASIPADLQANESELTVIGAGQTAMSHKRVFCDRLDIRENDKITDLEDHNGTHKVTSVNDHKTLSHMEIDCVSGTF